MAFSFGNTNKDIILTQEDEEDFEKTNICRFCEKEINADKVRYDSQLTSKYRGPAHNKYKTLVTQN